MSFPMKIQSIDFNTLEGLVAPPPIWLETIKLVLKSCFKQLFERKLSPSVLKNSATEKVSIAANEPLSFNKGFTGAEFEPCFVCLLKMIQNFIGENNEKQQQSSAVRCVRNRCKYFNHNCNEVFEDEIDGFSSVDYNLTYAEESPKFLKSLVSCVNENGYW